MNSQSKLLLFLCFILSVSLHAQQKELTLEASINQRFSTFYPKGVPQLQWMKKKQSISYNSEDNQYLLSKTYPFHKEDTLWSVTMLNDATGMTFNRIPRMKWLTEDEGYFLKNGQYYRFNTSAGTVDPWIKKPSGNNREFHVETGHIAYTKDNNLFIQMPTGEEIAVTDEENANIVSGQSIARNEFGIFKGIFWSPNANYLAFYQKDESDVTNYPLIDISSTPAKLDAIKYPMAGQKNEKASVGIYDLKQGQTHFIEVDTRKDQYLTNLTWGPNEQYLYVVIINRDQNHIWVNQYDAKTGDKVKTLFEEKHAKYVEPEHDLWFIPGKNDEFLWFSERDGFMHLYHYNTNGKLIGQLTNGAWEVLSILGLDHSKKSIYVMGTDTSGLNNHLYRVGLNEIKLEDLTQDEGMHRFNLSPNGKFFIDRFSNSSTAGVTQILDYHGRNLQLLKFAKNPLLEYNISSPEIFDLRAADSTILHARMIKPTHFDPEKQYPVIVYVYGGPHAQMVSNRFLGGAALWMYYAAQQGYIVFTLDNRGSSRRGFEFENVIHRQLGTVEMEDQLMGVRYLKSLPYIDTTRMAVHGWSFGGFMTTSMMLRQPGTFQVGVAGGPVTDWKYYEIMYGERYMDRPEENEVGYENNRLTNYVDQLEGNLLLIHGAVDPVVVPQHSLTLLKAFVDAKKQVDFFTYPMHPHNVRGGDRVHLMRKVLDYIDEKLR